MSPRFPCRLSYSSREQSIHPAARETRKGPALSPGGVLPVGSGHNPGTHAHAWQRVLADPIRTASGLYRTRESSFRYSIFFAAPKGAIRIGKPALPFSG